MEVMAFGLIWLLMMLVGGVIGIGVTVLWIWMLIDCVTKEPSEGNDKLIWVLIIVLTGWIGALIYLLVRRPQRKELVGH